MLRRTLSRRHAVPCRHRWAALAPAIVIFGSWSAIEPTRCEGQGLLQRLEERIRSRIEQRLAPRDLPDQPPAGADIRRGDRRSPLAPRVRSTRPAGDSAPPRGRADGGGGQPSLGVEATQHRGRVTGLEVVEFAPHSLADEAGMRVGDVIVAIDGAATATAAAASRQLRQRDIGASARLRVWRAGRMRNLVVPLVSTSGRTGADPPAGGARAELRPPESGRAATRPAPPPRSVPPRQPAAPDAQPPAAQADGWTERGSGRRSRPAEGRPTASQATAEESSAGTARLGAEWTDVEGEHGAQVGSVAEQSPAEVAGLRPGDRIVSVQGRVVTDAHTLTREIARHAPGDALVMQWVRGDDLNEAEVTLAGPDGISPLAGQDTASGEAAARPKSRSMLDDVGSALGNFFSRGESSAAEYQQPSSGQEADADAETPDSTAETPRASQESAGEEEPTSEAPSGAGTGGGDAAELLPAPSGNAEQSSTDRPASAADSSGEAAAGVPGPAAVRPASGGATQPPSGATLRASGALQQLGDRDPPSLRQITPPERTLPPVASDRESTRSVAELADEQEDASAPPPRWRETVERLRAEIERLEERIRQLEDGSGAAGK